MAAVSLVAASHLRRNRRSSVLIALLLSLAVAIVLAALAGARRTDSAVGEFVAADRAADGYAVFIPPAFGGSASPDLVAEETEVQAIDGVARTARFSNAIVELSGPTVPGGHIGLQGWVGMEPDGMNMLSQFRLVAGRHADQSKPDEILIDEELARDAELAVGSRVELRVFTSAQGLEGFTADAAGIRVEAEVVGIVRRPSDLRDPQTRQLQPNDYVVHQDVYLTAALWDAAHGDIAVFNPIVALDIKPGADLTKILETAKEQNDAYAIPQRRFLELAGTFIGVERSASLHSRGLQIFAAVVALAGLFLVGQTLGRQIAFEALDNDKLRVLGMTRRQLWRAALLRAAPVAVGGAVLGVAGAIALSPLMPLPGTVARRAELHPGVSVDAAVLVGGGILAAILAMVASALPSAGVAAAAVRDGLSRARPSLASRLAARGLPAPAVVGVRFALEPGRGRAAVPVRTAIVTAATALALVLAAVTFSSSLSGSRQHPSRYGVTWDLAAGDMTSPEEAKGLADEVRKIPGVVAFAAMGTTAFDTPFGEIPSVMIRQEQGTMSPLITAGRAPGPGEVALGALTMQKQNLHIGDELEIRDPLAGSRNFKITGTVVLNVAGVDVSIPPGRGALFDWSMLALLDPKSADFIAPKMFLVDVEPGRTTEVEAKLRALFPTSTRSAPVEPLDLTNLGDAASLPSALGAVVAILGIGTIAHAMLSAIRRRQRELAVLKVIGFVGSDTRRVVAWQALTFGLVAMLVGIPIGVVGGRAAWAVAAHQLGIPSYPVTSILSVTLVAVAFLVVLVLTALVPAQVASRVPVADSLRRD